MAALTPELYQQVRDLSRFKRDFTLDEIGRRAAIAAGIAGGMDPRAAQEYYLSQSPYRLTRSEFDSRLGQLMELAQLQARQEAAALRGDQAAARAVQSTQVALAKARADTNKAVAAAMAGSYGKGKVDRLQYLNELERELLYGEDTAISLQAEQLLRTANPGDPITTFLPGQSPVYKEIVDKVADLKGKSLERYLTKVAGLRGTTLDALKADLAEAAAGDSPWGSLSGDIEAKLEAVPGELTAIEEERAEIDRELRARMGSSPVAQLNAVNAAERTGRASGEGAAPLAADVSLIQQTLTEFPEEGPPIRMERERLQRGPEFQQFMEEFYGRSAEDRPFSDIEERMALRAARTQARKQARGERREGRQRLRALRKGKDFLRDEDFEDVPETRPGAQLAVPAAAKDTTATGVGEQPDINAYTTFKPKGDTHIYRTKDGINWEAARKETPNKFVKIKTYEEDASGNLVYTRNPESGELLLEIMYDKFKDSKERGELGEEGPSLDKETTETFFGSDVFEEVRAAAPKGKAPAPKVEPETGLLAVEEDEQEIAPIEDIPPVYNPLQEFTEEQFQAVEEATGRAPRPSFGQMIFEDARSRYPQVPPAQVAPEPAPAPAPPPVPEPPEPGSDEELLQNIYAKVGDTAAGNPDGSTLQDTTARTTEEVLAGQTPGREAGQEAASQARQQAGAATAGVFSKRVQDKVAKNILKRLGRNK